MSGAIASCDDDDDDDVYPQYSEIVKHRPFHESVNDMVPRIEQYNPRF